FYADKTWYNNFPDKSTLDSKLYNLASDFEYKIYPTLTNLLGFEDNPGIDNDFRIVIVLESLKDNYGGYIRSGDQYPKNKYPFSNEGQIIYLNADLVSKADLNFLRYELAHEFTHLITLKQKPEAETWFYELMSEFAGQLIGGDISQITKKRAQDLLYSTEVNLFNWSNIDKDYGKIYLFALYLREQFKESVFVDALKYPSSSGLISLNEALKKRGTNLEEVYLSWLTTNLYNTCEPNNLRYCFQDQNLKDFSVIAYSYYLPTQEKSSLYVTDSIKAFTGKWQKINGGLGTVRFKFSISPNTPIYKVPYILEDVNGKKTLWFFDLFKTNIAEIYIEGMGSKNKAIYFIPAIISSNLDNNQLYFYSFELENLGNNSLSEAKIIESLLKQIEFLRQQIAQLQLQKAFYNTYQKNSACSLFSKDLYYGMRSEEVKCLQQFLANLGGDIYPEKLITGYYGPLTMAAVKRYQAKYNLPQTGYFGPLTRSQANNELLKINKLTS
ncbi:MAG: peptidoglycan-binding domain-containing protein, partial [Minisyncoccia bacterium]